MDGWLAEENVRRSGGDVLFAVGGQRQGWRAVQRGCAGCAQAGLMLALIAGCSALNVWTFPASAKETACGTGKYVRPLGSRKRCSRRRGKDRDLWKEDDWRREALRMKRKSRPNS